MTENNNNAFKIAIQRSLQNASNQARNEEAQALKAMKNSVATFEEDQKARREEEAKEIEIIKKSLEKFEQEQEARKIQNAERRDQEEKQMKKVMNNSLKNSKKSKDLKTKKNLYTNPKTYNGDVFYNAPESHNTHNHNINTIHNVNTVNTVHNAHTNLVRSRSASQKQAFVANTMTSNSLQHKWWQQTFYDKLIEKENAKMDIIKVDFSKTKREFLNSANTNINIKKAIDIAKTSEKEQLFAIKNYIYQFRKIKKIINNQSNIIDNIQDPNLSNIVRNIITNVFNYELLENDNIDIEGVLTYPEDLVENSLIIKTSTNKHDCLIHSILINVSEEFRRLSDKHKNVIALFFRKIVFPTLLENDLTPEETKLLVVDPTKKRGNFYLDDDILGKIANYYKLNFIIISSVNEMLYKPIPFIDDVPFHIIFFRSNHFSAVSVNNMYEIPFIEGIKYFDEPAIYYGGYKSKRTKTNRHISERTKIKRRTNKIRI